MSTNPALTAAPNTRVITWDFGRLSSFFSSTASIHTKVRRPAPATQLFRFADCSIPTRFDIQSTRISNDQITSTTITSPSTKCSSRSGGILYRLYFIQSRILSSLASSPSHVRRPEADIGDDTIVTMEAQQASGATSGAGGDPNPKQIKEEKKGEKEEKKNEVHGHPPYLKQWLRHSGNLLVQHGFGSCTMQAECTRAIKTR